MFGGPPQHSFNCALPDGRNVNLYTQEGADAFLGDGQFPFISSNLEDVPHLRRARNTSQLRPIYALFGAVASACSKHVYANVMASELQALLDHAIQVFREYKNPNNMNNAKYLKSGKIPEDDQELLDSLYMNMRHYNFWMLVMESELFSTLAIFLSARSKKNNGMPSTAISEAIVGLVNNGSITLSIHRDAVAASRSKKQSSAMDDEGYFKRVESSGLLGQVLRCVSRPPEHSPEIAFQISLLDTILKKCPRLHKKTLGKDHPTGKILRSIVDGSDGFQGRRDSGVTLRMQNLVKMSDMANPNNVGDAENRFAGNMKFCRYCNKNELSAEFQKSLMQCSICKGAYYCSKDCQVGDWKRHKITCKRQDERIVKSLENRESTVLSFCMQNYYRIMKELVKITNENGIAKKEVVLEVDFALSTNGIAPALKEMPEFKIGITKKYIEGNRPSEPDWFYKNVDQQGYQRNIAEWLPNVKDHYERMTPDHLLTLVRFSEGSSIYRVQLSSEHLSQPLFSDKALDAFRNFLKDGDASELEIGTWEPQQISSLKHSLERDQSNEDMIKRDQSNEDLINLMQRINAFKTTDEFRAMEDQYG